MDSKTEALAIRIGERWYHGLSATGQILTAWTIAGARLFFEGEGYGSAITMTINRLKKKGKPYEIYKITAQRLHPQKPDTSEGGGIEENPLGTSQSEL